MHAIRLVYWFKRYLTCHTLVFQHTLECNRSTLLLRCENCNSSLFITSCGGVFRVKCEQCLWAEPFEMLHSSCQKKKDAIPCRRITFEYYLTQYHVTTSFVLYCGHASAIRRVHFRQWIPTTDILDGLSQVLSTVQETSA